MQRIVNESISLNKQERRNRTLAQRKGLEISAKSLNKKVCSEFNSIFSGSKGIVYIWSWIKS